MNIIKDKKQITWDYCRELEKWIKENPEKFFAKENEADSWGDFICWPDKKTDRNHLIMPSEICIIDRMWDGHHSYVICQFYGKECRKVRDLYEVVKVDDLKRSDWKNGYFLIPDLKGGNSSQD